MDQLTSAVHLTTAATPAVLARYGYAYDVAGNRTIEQIDDAATVTTHDRLNRLVTQAPGGVLRFSGAVSEPASVTVQGQPASVTSGGQFVAGAPVTGGTNTVTIAATDPSGNTSTAVFEVDQLGAAKNFTYDANGNLTADGTRTFEWDARNQLVAVTVGTHRSEFVYDGLQRRVRQVEKDNGVTTADTRVLWCEAAICEERAADGVTVNRRAFGLGEQIGGQARSFATDHLGSVREVMDSTVTLLARYAFDPWGRRTVVNGTDVTTVGYTGHRTHTPTGLALTRFRGYDAGVGSWASEDPLGRLVLEPLPLPLPGGEVPQPLGEHNLLAYVVGRPTVLRDPYGLAAASADDCSNNDTRCDSTYSLCYEYRGANARCFCRCADNGAWSRLVRCCLFRQYARRWNGGIAHGFCYYLATGVLGPAHIPVQDLWRCLLRCSAEQKHLCGCK